MVFFKVDTTPNHVVGVVTRTKMPADVLASKTSTVIPVIAPGLGFPTNRS